MNTPNDIIKTILVPVDFSASAKNAIRFAIELSKEMTAKLLLIHVYTIPVVPRPVTYILDPEAIQENFRSVEQQMNSIEEEIPELREVVYKTETIAGYGLIEIPEIIRNQHADLIVMGTKGASGFKGMILGSNTARVIEQADCPVLVIPESLRYTRIQNIGFAYDQEPLSGQPEIVALFARLFGASVDIFYIQTQEEKEKENILPKSEFDHYFKGLQYTYQRFYNDDIEEGINSCIERKAIDLIVMIPRKHDLLYRLFNYSLTKKMAFYSKLPLLIIPENQHKNEVSPKY